MPQQLTASTDREALTRDYGREIFARLRHRGPVPLSPPWWDDRLMDWTMANAAVKVELFRFIDVLPLLHSPAEINRHLREYLAHAGPQLPPWLRRGLSYLPQDGWAGRVLAGTARLNAERLARRFIAGSNLPEALRAV